MALTCPTCGAVNPDNARFCWNDGEKLVTTGFTPFQFTSGSSANSIEDLIILIEQNWDESKRYLYSDSFATWFSSIGRGDLTLAAQDIAQNNRDQDTGLRKLIRRMETNPTFRFSDGTKANTIDGLVAAIDTHWDEAKRYLYQEDDLADWLETIQRDDMALTAKDIVRDNQDKETGLRKLIRRMEKQPTFRFNDGTEANSIPEFVAAIDKNWEEGKRYLYNHDDLADWLETIQKDDFAKTARNIISGESDQDIGLEKFLQNLGSDAPPKPQLTISPSTIDFGTVDADKISKGGYTKQFTISNAGRGHLHGTVSYSESWVAIDKTEFTGNSTTITATAKAVGRSANIKIQSNGGTETLPATMNTVYPIWKPILSLECLIGAGVGLWLDYIVAFPLISAPNPIRGIFMGLSFGLVLSMLKWVRKIQRPRFYFIPAALLILGTVIPTHILYQESKIRTLVSNRDVRAVETLINALKGNDLSVRNEAARVLGEIGDARAVEPLIDALKDNEYVLRREAANALGEIGDARAVQPLKEALKDNYAYVRRYAAYALGEIGDAKAVEPLINALKDELPSVRRYAAGALGKIGDARAVQPLKEALNDEYSSVRTAAKEALKKIQNR